MSFDYNATAATATRLLTRFGRSAVLKRQTVGVYDPATGSAPVTETEHQTKATVFAYDQKYIDGTLIKQGDQRALMAPGVQPQQGDKFDWGGTVLEIVAVKPIAPAGVVVLYEGQVRG